MNSKEIVLDLLKKKRPDLSIAGLEREIGIANGTIGKWNTATPSTKTAQKVADYFHVPLMYIFGENNSDSSENEDNDLKKYFDEHPVLKFDGKEIPDAEMKIIKRILEDMDD